MMLALEPRFMFDAAVAAEVAEVVDQVADAADSGHAGDAYGGDANNDYNDYGSGSDNPQQFAAYGGIMPLALGSGELNEQPVINNVGSDHRFSGDEDDKISLAGITVYDPEGDTLIITIEVQNPGDKLFIDVPYDAGAYLYLNDGEHTVYCEGNNISGYTKIVIEGSPVTLNNVLGSLKYQGAKDWNGSGDDAATVKIEAYEVNPVKASDHEKASEIIYIDVAPQNDAPSIEGTPDQNLYWEVDEDTSMNFSDPKYNFTIGHPDNEPEDLTVTFTVSNGKLSFADNVDYDWENLVGKNEPATGDRTYTYTGSKEAINQLINDMSYQGNQDFCATETMRIEVADGLSPVVAKDVTIRVTAVDDPSEWGGGKDISVDEGVGAADDLNSTVIKGYKDGDPSNPLDTAHIVITDVDTLPNQITITVSQLPDDGKGVLELKTGATTWTELTVGSAFSYQDILDGKVRYRHLGEQARDPVKDGSEADRIVFTIEKLVAATETLGQDPRFEIIDVVEEKTNITLNVVINPINQKPAIGSDPDDPTIVYDSVTAKDAADEKSRPYVYEGEHGAKIYLNIYDPDQDPANPFIIEVTRLPVDGTLWYDDGLGGGPIQVTVGMKLSMDRINLGFLTYTHSGKDGYTADGDSKDFLSGPAFDGTSNVIPMGGVRNDGLAIRVWDDGGGEVVRDYDHLDPADAVSMTFTIAVRASSDLPHFADSTTGTVIEPGDYLSNETIHGTTITDVAGVLKVDRGPDPENNPLSGWREMVITNDLLCVRDNDSDPSSITYTISKTAGDNSITGGTFYIKTSEGYIVLGAGSSFTQDDVDNGRVVYHYHSGHRQGETGVHQGLDYITLTVRDGSKAVVDKDGNVHYNGFESGIGDLVDGEMDFLKFKLAVDVEFEAQDTHVDPPAIITVGPKSIAEDGDHMSTVYEGGAVVINNDDLNSYLTYTKKVGSDPAKTVTEADPSLTYRLENELAGGKLYKLEYTIVNDVVTFTGNRTEVGQFCFFTQRDLDLGAVVYEHDGGESASETLNLTVSKGDNTIDEVTRSLVISVQSVNDTPTASGEVVVNEGLSQEQIDAGDLDPEFAKDGTVLTDFLVIEDEDIRDGADSLSFVVVNDPAVGRLEWFDTSDTTGSPQGTWKLVVSASSADAYDPTDTSWATLKTIATVLTKQQLADGHVRYVHDGSEVYADSFDIIVNDGTGFSHSGGAESSTPKDVSGLNGNPTADDHNQDGVADNVITGKHGSSLSEVATIAVKIKPINDRPLEQTNDKLDSTFGDPNLQDPDHHGVVIDGSMLKYTDADHRDPSQVIYKITQPPRTGALYKKVDGSWEPLGTSLFTQADLDAGNIKYVHDGSERHTDLFKFDVGDNAKWVRDVQFDIDIDMKNAAPTIEVDRTGSAGDDYSLKTSGGLDISGVFKVDDPDYAKDPGDRVAPGRDGINTAGDTFPADTDTAYQYGDYMRVTIKADILNDDRVTTTGELWGRFVNATDGTAVWAGITVKTNAKGEIVIEGSREALNNALNNMRYIPEKDAQNEIIDLNKMVKMTAQVNDLGNGDAAGANRLTSSVEFINVFVSPIDDAPVVNKTDGSSGLDGGGNPIYKPYDEHDNTIPEYFELTADEDVWESVKNPVGGGYIQIVDVDHGWRNCNEITLSVSHGSLNIDTTGLEVKAGKNNSGSITLRGTIDQINEALKTLQYKADPNYNGFDRLDIDYRDGYVDETGKDWGTGDTPENKPLSCGTFVNIVIGAVNDRPTIDVPVDSLIVDRANPTYVDVTVGGAFVVVHDVDIEDPAEYGKDEIEVTVSVPPGKGSLKVDTTDAYYGGDKPAISGTGEGQTITIKGKLDAVNKALESLQYKCDASCAENETVDISVHVDDYGNGSNPNDVNTRLDNDATVTVLISGPNDPPAIHFDGARADGQTASIEDKSVVFTDANDNLIKIVDPDALDERITVTVSVGHGTLKLGDTSAFRKAPDGRGDSITEIKDAKGNIIGYTLYANQTKINAALDGLTYTSFTNWNGTDQLVVTSNDHGFKGNNDTVATDSRTIDIVVEQRNDTPSLATGKPATVDLGTITEDVEDTVGYTIDSFLKDHFNDAIDDVTADGGKSPGNAFMGVWVVASDTTKESSLGVWQYKDPATGQWKNIEATMFLEKSVSIRFKAADNYNTQRQNPSSGEPLNDLPNLQVRLVESKQDHDDYNPTSDCDIATGEKLALTDAKLKNDDVARYTNAVKITLKVKAVNDDPTIGYTGAGYDPDPLATPAPIVVDEDTPLAFTGANEIQFKDVDVGERKGGNVTVTLEVGNGTLRLGTIPSTVTVNPLYPNNSGKIEITGSLADINTLIKNLTYQAEQDYNGADTLKVTINDNGYSDDTGKAPGDVHKGEDSIDIAIRIDPVNDSPTLDTGKPGSISLADMVEDTQNSTGHTIGTIFDGYFVDAKDDSDTSAANAFIGVWVEVSDISKETSRGVWQYQDPADSQWKNIEATMFLNKDVAIRFKVADDYNTQRQDPATGAAVDPLPELKLRLVESKEYGGDYDHTNDCDLATGTKYPANGADISPNGIARYTDAVAVSLVVKAVNDAPEVTYTGGGYDPDPLATPVPIDVNEDTSFAFTGANEIQFKDIDVGERKDSTVTVTLEVGHGTLGLGTIPSTVTVNPLYPNNSGKIEITGSLADINTLIKNLTYQAEQDYNGTDTLHVAINDNGNADDTGKAPGDVVKGEDAIAILLNVKPDNDAPVIAGPNAANKVTILEDGSIQFTGADRTITVSDVDLVKGAGATDLFEVELSVANGTLTLGYTTGLTNVSNTGTVVKFKGSLSDINKALAGLTYAPTTDWNGADALVVKITDSGCVGDLAPETATKTVVIDVLPINDAPEVKPGESTQWMDPITEDSSTHAAQTVDSLFTPAFKDSRDDEGGSSADGLAGVLITGNDTLAQHGVWKYSLDGSTWLDVPANCSDARALYLPKTAYLIFIPAKDYNGEAPQLRARLVDDSAVDANNPANPAVPDEGKVDVNVSGAGKVDGTTRYSGNEVVLRQKVNTVNDSPDVVVGGSVVSEASKLYDNIDSLSPIVVTGDSVSNIFGGFFTDNRDQQHNAGSNLAGSTRNDFAGILVTAVPDPAYGVWEYNDGGTWRAITPTGANGVLIAAGTEIRFVPDVNASGEAGTSLTARLVDSSGGAIVSGSTASLAGLDGNVTDRYSEGVVKLDTYVLGENDPPTIDTDNLNPTTNERGVIQVAPTGTIGDVNLERNDSSWDNASLTVHRKDGASAQDSFVSYNPGVLGPLVEGGSVYLNGENIGTVTRNSGGVLTITFNDNSNCAKVNEVFNNLGYQNTSYAPPAQVELHYTVKDGNAAVRGSQGSGGEKAGECFQTIDIVPVDDDPAALDDANSIELTPERGGNASGNVLANDYDPDETPIRVVNPGSIAGKYGQLVLGEDGGYTYVVNPAHPDIVALLPGATLTETFAYTMADGNLGAEQTANLVIKITNNNTETVIEPESPKIDAPPAPPAPIVPPTPADPPIQNESGNIGQITDERVNTVIDNLGGILNTIDPGRGVLYDLDGLSYTDDIILTANPDSRNIYVNYLQEFSLPDSMFIHRDPAERLEYEAMLADGSPLPSWIHFDRDMMMFRGTPPEDVKGMFEVVILARDTKNNHARATLSINVRDGSELAIDNGFRDPDTMRELLEELEELGDQFEEELKAITNEPAPDEAEQPDADISREVEALDPETALLLESLFNDADADMALSEGADRFSDRIASASNTGLWLKALELTEAAAKRS